MSISKSSFKTLVFGASLKPYRYSHRAVKILKINGYEVIPIGKHKGEIDGISILTGYPIIEDVHTITMYINPARQSEHYEYLLSLNPKRIIFNPGAENPEFSKLAKEKGIYTENACTLVLLSIRHYENTAEQPIPIKSL